MLPYLLVVAISLNSPALPALHVSGPDLVQADGSRVLLKGCNLGNWHVIEPWMLETTKGFGDQYELVNLLTKRFGANDSERLMDLYRASWITPRDLKTIRSFGMNVVRLPMNYRLLEDDGNPFHLRKDAWHWIDRAVDMAENQGIYTILDMHGAQGGQSEYDHTGRRGQNKLWSVPENQQRLTWLWSELAKRYRNRSAVVAYDLFNEPYGGKKSDQLSVFKKVLAAVREVDPEKLVYAMGNFDGFEHYGDPATNGWKNVGFEMHYYPGLFGNGDPTVANYSRHLEVLAQVAKQVRKLNVPFLVGEMNVVFDSAGGAGMMRRAFDTDASYGWGTTMWSYKTVGKSGGFNGDSWAMATNHKPEQEIDFRTASKSLIESYFRHFATEWLDVNDKLRTALTSSHPSLPPLPALPTRITSAPAEDVMAGWTASDIGGSRAGGLKIRGEESFDLYGGGNDIWSTDDQFRFLSRKVSGDFIVEATVESMTAPEMYAKSGLMARSSIDSSAATWLISVFPSGGVQVAARSAPSIEMKEIGSTKLNFPIKMRIEAAGGAIKLSAGPAGEPLKLFATLPRAAGPLFVGPIALSHDDGQLVRVRYRDLTFRT
jgi:endoglucanase